MGVCFGGIDPVEGLVQFTLDVKPYHTKILEVEVEYVYTDLVDVTIVEDTELVIHIEQPPILDPEPCSWGYGIAPFGEPFVQDQSDSFSIINIDESTNELILEGDQTETFTPGSYSYGDLVVDDGSGESQVLRLWDVVDSSYDSGSDLTTLILDDILIPSSAFERGLIYSIPFGRLNLVDVNPQQNYFLVEGDHREAFTYAIEFNIVSSTQANNRRYSTLGSGRATFPVLGANDANNFFVISGDWTAYLEAGDIVEIRYSSDYDGDWTISSTLASSGLTQIFVQENVPAPADPFSVDYGILLSDKLTRIQVTESVDGESYKIVDVDEGLNQFIVDGDQTSSFSPGDEFRIYGSATYDAQVWTTSSSTFDDGTGSPGGTSPRTYIEVVEDIVSKTSPFGTIYFDDTDSGFVVPTFIGYSDIRLCDKVPKGKVMGHIGERLQISSEVSGTGETSGSFVDNVSGTVVETVNVNMVTTGISLIGAYDGPPYDVGAYDEDIDLTASNLSGGTF